MSLSKIFVNTQDTGFEGIPLQQKGESTTVSMSQKAVTDEIEKLNANDSKIELACGIEVDTESFVGYMGPNFVVVGDKNFRSLKTAKIPTKEGEKFKYRGNSSFSSPGVFLFNGDTLVSTQTGSTIEVTISSGIDNVAFCAFGDPNVTLSVEKLIPKTLGGRVTDLESTSMNHETRISYSELKINKLENNVNSDDSFIQKKRISREYSELNPIIDSSGGVYNWKSGYIYEPSSEIYRYSKFDVDGLEKVYVEGLQYRVEDGYALAAFVDSSENALEHTSSEQGKDHKCIVDVPENAKFLYVNGNPSNSSYPIEASSVTETYYSLIPEIDQINNIKQEKRYKSQEESITPIIDNAGGLYDWRSRKIYEPSSNMYRYSKFDVDGLEKVHAIGRSWSVSDGYALIAFVDENEDALSHLEDSSTETTLDVPSNAKYAYVNTIVNRNACLNYIESGYYSLIPEIDVLNELALSDETKPTPDSTKLIKSGVVAQRLTEIDLELGLDIEKKEFVGYIKNDLSVVKDINYHSYISSKIPVKYGEIYTYYGHSNNTAIGIFLLSDDTIVSTNSGTNITFEIQSGINYIRVASYAVVGKQIILSLTKKNNLQQVFQQKRESELRTSITPIIDSSGGVYNWKSGYIYRPEDANFRYSKFDVSNVSKVHAIGRSWAVSDGYALIAFVDENEDALSHLQDSSTETTLDVPSNAKYAYVNGSSTQHISLDSVTNEYTSLIPEIDNLNVRVSSLENSANLKIICTGDSVTEGMGMSGGGYAEYGKDCYPAQLCTMLVDNGYNKYEVINQGQGGETVPVMSARLGSKTCYVIDSVQLPNDLSWVLLSHSTSKFSGNLAIYYPDKSGQDYYIRFTSIKEVTSPLFIDNNYYNAKLTTDWSTYWDLYISKLNLENTETEIPSKATVITPAKNAYINILYGGINDGNSINFEKWSEMHLAMLQTSSEKGLVIGFYPIWRSWNDISGSNNQEKYIDFRTKSYKVFGDRFLDLYDLFFRHALDICLEKGYYSDKTEQELQNMRELLNQHILPAEMSYDYTHQGDCHLSKEGYYAMAKLIFNRLIALRYIYK